MATEPKPTASSATRPKADVEASTHGTVVVITLGGLVDEHFPGFGSFANTTKSVVINATGITRMTSFGVRQWLKAMDSLPKSAADLYLLGCPTFFVDQLNMVLNFGGGAQILTVAAPYNCPSCGQDSGEIIDVLAERAALAKGGVPEKLCSRCGAKLEFDETPESYFSFVNKYSASTIEPATAAVLAQLGLYAAAAESTGDKPLRIIKLVRGSVTYFRIGGVIGSMFRARPFLVGAEGEVVLDLAEIDRVDPAGQREWRRLLKTLSAQVVHVTLVDVNDSFLASNGDSHQIARNVSVWSVLVPYVCIDCGRVSRESQPLHAMDWPPRVTETVCSTCGGSARSELPLQLLTPLISASMRPPAASTKLIEQRDEVLSRELTDANVAQAGAGATASLAADDTILGKYKIVRRLSAGGMAEVFLAKQIGIGGFEKPVALKRIQHQLLESRHLAIDMFLNEAKIAGRLMHPNIVQVLDVGEVGGALYLAMEYVHGKDLRDVAKQLIATGRTMPLGEVCLIVREVAQALHHAYWSTDMAGNLLSVVHRDVSPHNIIVSYDGAVKLLDFGVAMSAVTEQAESVVVGKWSYMSPEQAMNQTNDHRSDLFSLGVTIYQLCTGTLPFIGSTHQKIVKKMRAGQHKRLDEVAPHLPPQLCALVTGLLEPNPDDRPQTGQEVAGVLGDIARAHGVERAPADLVRFLTELFPDDHADGARPSGVFAPAASTSSSRRSGSPLSSPMSTGSVTAIPPSLSAESAATIVQYAPPVIQVPPVAPPVFAPVGTLPSGAAPIVRVPPTGVSPIVPSVTYGYRIPLVIILVLVTGLAVWFVLAL